MIIHGSLASKDFDKAASVQYGITTLHLMEIAGKVYADEIDQDFKKSEKKALLVSGPGNNGGDSFVIARFLISDGWNVTLILLNPTESYLGASLENLMILNQMAQDLSLGLHITLIKNENTFQQILQDFKPDVLVDALFGVGLTRNIVGLEERIIYVMNQSCIPIYAIDIPSGISADHGQILGQAVKATKTITFETMKFGHMLYPGKEYSGEVVVKQIGFPLLLKKNFSSATTCLNVDELKPLFRSRPANAYKGTFGKAFLFGGSKHYQGALELSVQSCLKSGAGVVHAIYNEKLSPFLGPRLPAEVVHEIVPSNHLGELDLIQFSTFLSTIQLSRTSIGVGPGIGRDLDVIEAVQIILKEWMGALVIDADGLFAIKDCLGNSTYSPSIVLTPHLGEMAYLTGVSIDMIQADLVGTAKHYASLWNTTLVLKSSSTVIADPSGKVFVNQWGNSGMAKGGSGDVLTGIICSFLAQGYNTMDASILGVCIHSLAGDLAAKTKGFHSMLPTDICQFIPKAFSLIQN